MKERVVYVLKMIVIIILFPLFLAELGRFTDDLYNPYDYDGGE